MPLNHTRIQAARSVIQTTLGVLIFGDILTLSVGIFAVSCPLVLLNT